MVVLIKDSRQKMTSAEEYVRLLEERGFVVVRGVASEASARGVVSCVEKILESLEPPKANESGRMVRGISGQPLAEAGFEECNKWREFFESPRLLEVLHVAHDGEDKWRWSGGAETGLGWVHLRFPLDGNWLAEGYHIDGDTRDLMTQQSIVVLPVVTALQGNCGGTAVLPGSHREVAKVLRGKVSVSRDRIGEYIAQYLAPKLSGNVEKVRGEPGDAILLHPLTIHASSRSLKPNGIRVTFNLATTRTHFHDLKAPLDRCLLLSSSSSEDENDVVHYGEPIFLRFLDDGTFLEGHHCAASSSTATTAYGACAFLERQSTQHVVGSPVTVGDDVSLFFFKVSACLDAEPNSDGAAKVRWNHVKGDWQRMRIEASPFYRKKPTSPTLRYGDPFSLRGLAQEGEKFLSSTLRFQEESSLLEVTPFLRSFSS